MEMKRLNSGRLRAAGYERGTRTLRVELDDGSAVEYSGVGEEVWRRLAQSGSAWSFYRDAIAGMAHIKSRAYRDAIEEEFAGRRVTAQPREARANPLDELFGKD